MKGGHVVDVTTADGETDREVVGPVCRVVDNRVVRSAKRNGERYVVTANGLKVSDFLAPEEGIDGAGGGDGSRYGNGVPEDEIGQP